MKQYDIIIKNWGIVYKYNKNTKRLHGHIDYLGKNGTRRHSGNSFTVENDTIYWDFPYDVPNYVTEKIESIAIK